MIDWFKTILRTRVPSLYHGLQSVYYGLRKVGEKGPLGGVFNRVGWILKHAVGSREGYDQASAALPHRTHIVDHVTSFGPPDSILEIGCGYGANLVNLSEHLVGIRIAGVDVSTAAIAGARSFASLADADLRVHDLGKPLPFANGSFDVVLSDAVLMFFSDSRLPTLLKELLRVSRRGVVLHEYNAEGHGGSLYVEGRWIHDFQHECADAAPDATVEVFDTPFAGGLWSSHGKFLLVRKSGSEVQ